MPRNSADLASLTVAIELLCRADAAVVAAAAAMRLAAFDLRDAESYAVLCDSVATGPNAEQRRAQVTRYVAPKQLLLDAAEHERDLARAAAAHAARLHDLARLTLTQEGPS